MVKWTLDTHHAQPILTHYCEFANNGDNSSALRQDLGGAYVRCDRCGEKYLPAQEPGNPRLILRYRPQAEAPEA